MSLFLIILLCAPIILLLCAWAIVGKISGRKWALAFVLTASSALAINLGVGFWASREYAAKGGWTAATLTPTLHWVGGNLIVVICLVLWLFSFWIARCRIRHREGGAQRSDSN